MLVQYTTATRDDPNHKCLITGRADDLTKLLDDISQGYSVVLFGERKIGKTVLLYLIRDIVNNDITAYQNNLIDTPYLTTSIPSLRSRMSGYQVIYLNLQSLPILGRGSSGAFTTLLYQELQDQNLGSYSTDTHSFTEAIENLDQACQNQQKKILFLIDESELFLKLEDKESLFNNLNNIILNFSQICFLFAGGELWFNSFKDYTNRFLREVRFHYLKAASATSMRDCLIKRPLSGYINPNHSHNQDVQELIEQVVKQVVEWTDYKPQYVQAVCLEIVNLLQNNHNQLPQRWKELVLSVVEPQEATATFQDFYTARYNGEIHKKILALLSHQPELEVKEISRMLNISQILISRNINDLELLGKIKNNAGRYRIVGTLIESWGKNNIELPSISSPNIEKLKKISQWGLALLFVVGAISAWKYTNPSLDAFSCNFSDGKALLQLPSSLEVNEAGKAIVEISNKGQKKLKALKIKLNSNDIRYQKEGTNQVAIDSLDIGQSKIFEFDFLARDVSYNTSQSSLRTKLIISNLEDIVLKECDFNIFLRHIPLKQYWVLVSGILTVVSAFLVKNDLLQLGIGLSTLLSNSSKSMSENENHDTS